MPASSRRLILNICFFQAGWWACVISAAYGYAWLGVSTVAVIAVVHFFYVSTSRRLDLLLACAALLVGLLANTAIAAAGAMTFPPSTWARPLAPAFMLALWFNFALTLTTMLRWLRRRYVLAALVGALGGPLAYFAGARLGALILGPLHTPLALLLIAAEWALAIPLLLLIRELLDSSPAAGP